MKAEKVTQPPHSFVPVRIILETQEEVDTFYALLNHRSLGQLILDRVFGERSNDLLFPFTSEAGRNSTFATLCRILRNI